MADQVKAESQRMSTAANVSASLVAAVILGELVSLFWVSHRSLLTGVLCDIGLAIALQVITRKCWYVRNWEDALRFAALMGMVYMCLEGPYTFWHAPISRFFFIAAHKFTLILVMVMALTFFKDY